MGAGSLPHPLLSLQEQHAAASLASPQLDLRSGKQDGTEPHPPTSLAPTDFPSYGIGGARPGQLGEG